MKKIILFIFFALSVSLSFMGCSEEPKSDESLFVGKWYDDEGGLYYPSYRIVLEEDFSWSLIDCWEEDLVNYGSWEWNGDNTITLLSFEGKVYLATYGNDYDKETELGGRYLLIGDTKYYKR